jgi:hypothetical protein
MQLVLAMLAKELLQADLRWLEACEQNWTGRRSRS